MTDMTRWQRRGKQTRMHQVSGLGDWPGGGTLHWARENRWRSSANQTGKKEGTIDKYFYTTRLLYRLCD